MPEIDRFQQAIERGSILLDAAMGTRLIARGLDLAIDDPSSWVLRHPDLIFQIHRQDVEAGADAVLTNTFGANRAWLGRSGLAAQAEAINRRAVELARSAVGPKKLILGSIGPTALGAPGALREQAEALVEAGVDALILETYRLDQALEALGQLVPSTPRPIIASLYLWPKLVGPAARSLADAGASVIGANCLSGMGPAVLLARKLHPVCDLPILIKPSPGPASPGLFARAVPRLIASGVRLIGGCCGSDATYLVALKARF